MAIASTIEVVLSFTAFGAAFARCCCLWKKKAIQEANQWCLENDVVQDNDGTFVFMMTGRPARLEFTGKEKGVRYVYVLNLYSGFLDLPSTFFGVWGRVELASRTMY